jgi:hypothetical protein
MLHGMIDAGTIARMERLGFVLYPNAEGGGLYLARTTNVAEPSPTSYGNLTFSVSALAPERTVVVADPHHPVYDDYGDRRTMGALDGAIGYLLDDHERLERIHGPRNGRRVIVTVILDTDDDATADSQADHIARELNMSSIPGLLTAEVRTIETCRITPDEYGGLDIE